MMWNQTQAGVKKADLASAQFWGGRSGVACVCAPLRRAYQRSRRLPSVCWVSSFCPFNLVEKRGENLSGEEAMAA